MAHDPDEAVPPQTARAGAGRRGAWWIWLLALGVLAGGAYVIWTRAGETRSGAAATARNPPAPAVPVTAVAARMADIGVYLTGLGSVTPLNTVTVRTRVDGQLISVRFREGQLVERGDLLAEIDPRPFEVQLRQAEGQLARDRALLQNAGVDLQRYRVLAAQDSIPKQQLDTQESLVRQYEGTVAADQGQVDAARLQLDYCRITSPLTGRVGLRLVDPGNLVHAADATGLVVITQLQPIAVLFTIPEDSVPSVLDQLQHGVRLPVEAYDREQRRRLASGWLLTIDNQVDPATGTVRLKAQFANAEHALFPNQFVNARLQLDVKRQATVVPAAAIQRSPRGTFVYVVKPDRAVEARPVTVGITDGDTVSIDTGLTPGESVVVDGVERLREGSRVDVRTRSGA